MSGAPSEQSDIPMLSTVQIEVRNSFDNVADPFQTRNLIDEPELTNLRDQFRIALQQRMNAIKDTFEACTWYRDNWTEDRIILCTAMLT